MLGLRVDTRSLFLWVAMKKRPFLLAFLTVGGIFLFFLLVILTAGLLRSDSRMMPVGDKIGVLQVSGTIVEPRGLIERIERFRKQGAIKAVVLRINSPGGGVGPSQEVHAALVRLAESKPLIVSMGAVAASGGYYLAVAGERLFANPGTLTGSIGVIMSFPNYHELMDRVGIQTRVVKSGRYKDVGSATRTFTEDDRSLLQDVIDDVHQQFVTAVSNGRELPVDRLQPYIDGRIMTGRQARDAGLVDELGTLRDAVEYAAKVSGLGTDPALVYSEPEEEGFLERYLKNALSRYLNVRFDAVRMMGPQYLWTGD